jgi:hypothetical protein
MIGLQSIDLYLQKVLVDNLVLGPLAQSVEQQTFNPASIFPEHQYYPVLTLQCPNFSAISPN